MKRLCSARDMIEAQLLADMLKQDGIEVRVFNQYARGAMGEIPFTHTDPEVWLLDEADYAQAAAVLHTLRSTATHLTHKACRGCGEELTADLLSCWNCGTHQ